MMNTPNTDERSQMTPQLAEALALLNVAARKVIAGGLVRLPPVHAEQIKNAIQQDQCRLTVQYDYPTGNVHVLADGDGWLKPQVLFATEWKEPNSTPNYQ